MARAHKTCEVCWEGDVLTTGVDQCARCRNEWLRIVKAYNELLARYPKLRIYSVATVFERLVKRAIQVGTK